MSSFRAEVESSMRGLSRLRAGSRAGLEPVATMQFLKRTFEPLSRARVVASSKRARVDIQATLRRLPNSARLLAMVSTTLSFLARRASTSILGGAKVMPQGVASCARLSRWTACRRALEGMQPVCKQTPPGLARASTRATCIPLSAARNAAAYPPGPAPMTAKSHS